MRRTASENNPVMAFRILGLYDKNLAALWQCVPGALINKETVYSG